MKNMWHVWGIFSACLAGAIIALAFLTVKTINLDRLRETDRAETELARREAELQERVSSALYRMDLKMLPLISLEAAQPHYVYRPFHQPANFELISQSAFPDTPTREKASGGFSGDADMPRGGSDPSQANQGDRPNETLIPSSLLIRPGDHVYLHFQLDEANRIISPEVPRSTQRDSAIETWRVPVATLEVASQRLQQARQKFKFSELARHCESNLIDFSTGDSQVAGSNSNPVYSNGITAMEHFQRQVQEKPAQPVKASGNKIEMQQLRGVDRGNQEYARRLGSTQLLAGQNMRNLFGGYGVSNQGPLADQANGSALTLVEYLRGNGIQYGVMQPLWIDGQLLLVRHVEMPDQNLVQCCWLDWDSIRRSLQAEVEELLPGVQFQPITGETNFHVGKALTTLPVQLVVDQQNMLASLALAPSAGKTSVSGIRMSLLVAWCGLALAAMAVAMLLFGVIRLSERRAAFVSSVTHELRSPLTTFRMYAEMFAEDMVPEGKQQRYAQTLKIQADRLAHLVENVLQFARLERGGAAVLNEEVSVGELINRFKVRLVERSADADMRLEVKLDEKISETRLTTQVALVEQIIFNLVDNACKYAQSAGDKRILISGRCFQSAVQISVRDFGPGIESEERKRLFRPFYRSKQAEALQAQGVGLGLALCRRLARDLGGRLFYQPTADGAEFVLEIPR